MQVKDLQLKRALRSVLIALLLSALGMGKMYAQSFTVGDLNYSVNDDGVSVTLTGHVDGQGATGELIIPETVTHEGTSYPVTMIGSYAFYFCNSLMGDLVIPNSVTTIGSYAFCFCNSLTGDVVVPNSVTTIGEWAFYQCRGFTGDLVISNSVTSIGEAAFAGCINFESIVVDIGNTFYDSRENCNAIIQTGTNNLITGCNNSIIPNSVTLIGSWAFSYCSGLTGDLVIPDSVTSIGDQAFYGCNGLTGNLTIGNSVTSIGEGAFGSCYSLIGDLVIPNSVTTIGEQAFYGCSGFTGDLVIPNSVTSIGRAAFAGCINFESIMVVSGNTFYDSRENCNALIQTSTNNLIFGCKNSIIPNSVTSIGEYAFSWCSGLTGSLVIPSSVTSIGEGAFEYCSGLTGGLVIPNSVTSIGYAAFYSCSGLSSISVLAENPPFLDSDVFSGVDQTIPVYVPCNSISAYQSATGWNEFNNYLPATECFSGEITVTTNPAEGGMVMGTGYYEGGATCTLSATSNEGFNFLNWTENGTIVSNNAVYNFVVSGDRNLVANFVEGDLCTITFDLFDSYGDGYTGNYLVVTDENGISQQLTVESGSSAVYTLQFLTGSHIILTWIVGSYPEDCSFTVSYSNGTVIYQGSNLNSNFNYEFDVDCNSVPDNIVFADANVKALCVANWDTNGDGELSYAEAAAVTDLGYVFSYNTEIASFEELQYFTGLTSISSYAFCYCYGLTGNLVIPSSVTSIGDGAFAGCSGLMGDLVIPNSVTSIGEYAFYGCNGFTGNLTIGSSVTSISDWAFCNCSGFTGSLTIGNSVTSIGDGAFGYCSGLTGGLVIPNSVTTIGEWAFSGCSSFESIVVDSDNTFYDSRDNCNALIRTDMNELIFGCKNSIIPNSVTSIGEYAFYNCSGLTGDLVIPNSVTSIGEYAFYNCSGLTGDLLIPNSVTSIGEEAFVDCYGFTGSLTIGNSVTTIGSSAFYDCSGLTGDLVIPNSVTSIGSYAFHNCSGLTGSLTIGNSLTTIGYETFSWCYGLTGDLVIPNSVTTIGERAFYGCGGFTGSLTIGNSVTTIGERAFRGCSGFTGNLTIGNSVTMIGERAFDDCRGFTGNLLIPNSVTTIGGSAFNYCYGFTGSLTIGNSVTTIGNEAFYYCSGLTGDLVIPNSVTSIGEEAFAGCSGLTGDLVIPNSVTSIGDGAFYNCYGLTGDLVIPNSVNTIGVFAFAYCSGFTGDLVIPNSVTTIGYGTFYGCSGFTGDLVIPNSVTSIGEEAFAGCSGFTGNLVISNSVNTIGYAAFYNCSGLTGNLTIGNSVTSIGEAAFWGCSGLAEAMIFRTTPPSLGNGAFPFTSFPIYVPYESLNTYTTASGWNGYGYRIYPMSYTTISGYGESEGNWRFIASPLVENTAPITVNNMITESDYDLYRFDQSEDFEWQNYEYLENTQDFMLVNGQGYLYANVEDVNLIFKGVFNEDETKDVELAYDANANLAGWNLVGNPFPVSAYANRSYYVMNEEGTAIEPVAVSMETAIPTCTGVMVKADNVGETVTFSKTALRGQENQGVLQIAVAQAETRGASMMDKAIVSFNSDDRLEKFVFIKDNAQLYIPRGKDNYAIVNAEKTGEMPLNFEAKKNGSYTITVDAEMVDMDYLHLIDNLTGNDVDLLVEPSYTFESKTTDYASRFRLVFSADDAGGDACVPGFAFINGNGNISILGIEGEATLQVMDVSGHVLSSETFSGSYEKKLNVVPGVYMLRLINGDDVKVQKIVVR